MIRIARTVLRLNNSFEERLERMFFLRTFSIKNQVYCKHWYFASNRVRSDFENWLFRISGFWLWYVIIFYDNLRLHQNVKIMNFTFFLCIFINIFTVLLASLIFFKDMILLLLFCEISNKRLTQWRLWKKQ